MGLDRAWLGLIRLVHSYFGLDYIGILARRLNIKNEVAEYQGRGG